MKEADQPEYRFEVDKEKAMRNGVAPAQVVATINAALSNMPVGILHNPVSFDPVNIVLQLNDADKASISDIQNLTVISQQGTAVSIGNLVHITKEIKEKSIYRKNQKRVVYVMADLAGELESPFYAIMGISDRLKEIKLPKGYVLDEIYNGPA